MGHVECGAQRMGHRTTLLDDGAANAHLIQSCIGCGPNRTVVLESQGPNCCWESKAPLLEAQLLLGT